MWERNFIAHKAASVMIKSHAIVLEVTMIAETIFHVIIYQCNCSIFS